MDATVLLIDDDPGLLTLLKLGLERDSFAVHTASNGKDGVRKAYEHHPDVIVLDVMMEGMDGWTTCQRLRQVCDTPIIMLTALASGQDIVKGLSFGVDDYLSKPFNLEEFLLRVKRLLIRASWTPQENHFNNAVLASISQVYTFGGNRIDFETSTADCRRGKIRLTEQEVKLLKLFIARQGKALSRRQILEIGWGYTGGMTTRTVDNFIVRFRKYFEKDPKKPVYF